MLSFLIRNVHNKDSRCFYNLVSTLPSDRLILRCYRTKHDVLKLFESCIPEANCNNLCPRLGNISLNIANELTRLSVLSICHQHHDAIPLPQHLMTEKQWSNNEGVFKYLLTNGALTLSASLTPHPMQVSPWPLVGILCDNRSRDVTSTTVISLSSSSSVLQ
jgi:hypothetical protein